MPLGVADSMTSQSLIADIVNDILKPVEIDPALTEQESVFLAVNLADILAAQAIDLPVDWQTNRLSIARDHHIR